MRRALTSRLTRVAFVAAAAVLALLVLVPKRTEIGSAIAQIGFLATAASLVAVLAALTTSMQVWRELLAALGSRVSTRTASQIVFVGQLGKYLPGSVWPVLAQMELGAANAVPRTRTATSSVLMLLVNLMAGLATAACILPFMTGSSSAYRWAFLAAPVLVACLHPRSLNWLMAVLLRLVRRPDAELVVEGRGIVRAVGWALLQWILYGVHIGLLMLPLSDSGPRVFVVAVGAFALAWCVGFLALLAPAGAGVREVVLIALLAPDVGVGAATAVALLSRVVASAGDLITAGIGIWLGRAAVARARAGRGTPPSPAQP